ncbi:MAG: M24 family metallopeptidase [Deltaproteobacteria bacterium]|jgi:Xaa-Pro dipeptidase|nr:M24 family metallopeptidase [Deltaproteobacteria bacterium]
MDFELSEYHERLAKVKRSMAQKGLDVLVASDPSNMKWLTGYDGWSFYVHQGLIVALDRPEPIWWGRGMDANGAKLTTWLSPDSLRPYADDYVQNPAKHPMSHVASILREFGWLNKRVGAEHDNYWFTGRCLQVLEAELQAPTADATGLINWERLIKSPTEIAYLRQAAVVCRGVMEAATNAVRPGRLERDAAAAVYAACVKGVDGVPGDHPAIFPIMPSNERTTCAHLGWAPERIYQPDDLVLLELCGVHRRYHCPLSRTVYLGRPPRRLADLAAAVLEGVEAALAFVKPGVEAWEVEACWRSTVSKRGVVKPSRLGYSIGASYVPDWGERTVSLRPDDHTVLGPNMTFHLMPGIWEDDLGFESSEPFLVTETGCEPLMGFPRGILTPEL